MPVGVGISEAFRHNACGNQRRSLFRQAPPFLVSCSPSFPPKFRIPPPELAERARLHRNYVGGVERGERNVALENIVKLAKAPAVRPADLFTDFS
jgi:transcriptional regulator with XRE-family HTH domain